MGDLYLDTDTSLGGDDTMLQDITPNISLETNASNATEDVPRKEIRLDMDRGESKFDDPLVRFKPVTDLLHAWSPLQGLVYLRLTATHVYQVHRAAIQGALLAILVLAYIVYLAFAFRHSFGDEPSVRLLVVTILIIMGVAYHFIKKYWGQTVYSMVIQPIHDEVYRYRRFIMVVATLFVASLVFLFIIIEAMYRRPASLISAIGILVFTSTMFLFSKEPRQVTWRPVLWGLLLQLVFALIVLRTKWGYYLFIWLGDRVTEYLAYTDQGSTFVFGDNFRDHFFAFSVMPVIIFFSASISILYYLGVVQLLIEKISVVMRCSMGTGAMESLHAALNIFVGWGEAVALVQPLLDKMSLSELHTVMTNGFATVAGSTLALYIMYGAPANHLLSASVMSAPAALAMSKLFYPETRENRHRKLAECKIEKRGSGIIEAASAGAVGAIGIVSYIMASVIGFVALLGFVNATLRGSGIIEAASAGAVGAIGIVSYIMASVIGFVALLGFVNATLQWFGERVGLAPPDYPILSFQLVCSYLFWPVVFLMGVAPQDCFIVGRIVGIKTFVNEIIAYEDLGHVVKNRVEYLKWSANTTGAWVVDGNGNFLLPEANLTLSGGVISDHSAMIATYALCGFSNILGLGIMIGALSAAAPSRKDDIVKVSIRALISGCMACFLTACIAGLLGDA